MQQKKFKNNTNLRRKKRTEDSAGKIFASEIDYLASSGSMMNLSIFQANRKKKKIFPINKIFFIFEMRRAKWVIVF